MSFEKFLSDFNMAMHQARPFVVITLVNIKASAPQEVGARMIVTQKGYFSGTIGGGKLEMAATQKAQEYLISKQSGSHFVEWNLQTDIKMSCGGAVSLFFEIHNPETSWNVVIFGAGHVAQELVRVLLRLECQIKCIDTREEWLAKLPRDSKLHAELALDFNQSVSQLNNESFVVLATMGHATDVPILEEILNTKSFSYVGVLGSDLKAKKIRKHLEENNFSLEKINSYYCPIGEDLGNNTPAEIAISVTSQLLKVRDTKTLNHKL